MSSNDLYKSLMGKYSASGGANSQEEPKSKSSGHQQTYQTLMNKYNQEVNEGYVNRFIKDANTLFGKYDNNVGYITGRNIYDQNSNVLEDLNTRARVLKRYFKDNAGQYENQDQILESVASITSNLEKYGTYLKGQQDYYSQFKTQEDYDKYITQKEAYEAKINLDLDTAAKEIEDLRAKREDYAQNHEYDWTDFSQRDAHNKALEEMDAQIAQKKQFMNQARHTQEGAKLSSVADPNSDSYDSDFRSLSKYSTTIQNDHAWWSNGTGDAQYEWINNQNGYRDSYESDMDALNSVASATSQSSFYVAPVESAYRKNGYDHLTKNEIAIYNYYYAKDGKDKAQEYLDSIQETLNYRKATEMYGELEDQTALELAFSAQANLDRFSTDIRNLFNTEDNYIPQSAMQMTSGMVREDLGDVGFKLPAFMSSGGVDENGDPVRTSIAQVAYDAIGTTAYMAPSILTSVAVSMLASPVAGAAAGQAAGQWAGRALMGMSAAGGAYQEALNDGYDKNQARGYGLLVGASEIVMESVLGGISELGGGNVLGKTLIKNLGEADTALKMIAKNLGGSMLSEFGEEYLQEVLTPVFKNLTLGTDEDVKLFSAEALYSGILGALTAGIMEGPTAIAGEVNTYSTGKQLLKSDVSAQRLAEIGKTFSADTVAYKLAGKVDENTGAYTMGRLFNEIGATMTEQNVNDITNALVKEGIPEKIAKNKANLMAKIVDGAELTEVGIQAIEEDTLMSKVMKTTFVDANSTWFQRSKGYNEVLKALAQEKASRTNPAEQGEANDPTSDKVDTENKNGAEEKLEVDTSPSKVISISTIKDGQVTLKLEDGSEVDITEADLDPDDGVRIETIAKIGGISANDANFILGTLKATPGASAQIDALGAKEAYQYGFYGISDAHMAEHGVFVNTLGKTQRDAIYKTGREARAKQTAAQQTTVSKKESVSTAEKSSQVGKVHFDGNHAKLTARQKASLTAMEKVAEVMGVQIHVFESKVGKNGKHIGANGWYDPRDNSIHIDLHAGANGEGTMLFTLSHELTHHIRKWSPEKFKVLSDFLMEEYGKKGENVDALVRKQQEKAKRSRNENLSYDAAWEEVVADSMETMLADGNVLNRLEKLKAKDKDLWHEVKRFINDLADKIRAVYNGLTPDSEEGRIVADMGKAVYRLQELFADALMDASENYQASLTPGEEGVVANQDGEPVASATADGTVQLSMRTYEEDGRSELRKYLKKCVSSNKLTKTEMQEMMDGIEDIYQICKEFKDQYAPFSSWSDAAVVRDTYGKPVFSVVTPNGDYKMNLDFSLVCKKRRTLDAVFNEMSRRGIIDDFELGQKSVVKINEIIRKHGLETACALCFVDAKRFRQASMADQFTNLYNELVLSLVPEGQRSSIEHFNFGGYETFKKVEGGIHTWNASKLDFSHLDDVMKNYGKGTVEHKAAKYIKSHPEGRKLLLRGDFMSSHGFDAVKTQNKDILKLYNSKKGTGGPKAAFGDVQYMNEIVKKARTWTPAKAYAVGGVRIQSFSDYVPRMVFDYTQMIYDLAATKLPAHAYTKEALFVKQFGLTGVKINMSLIPAIAEGGIAPGLDDNGNYVWAGESFDYETAKEIQNAEGYTENCGTICVGVSKQHIEKLLRDPNIRMVIPYHKSGLNPIVAHMNKIAEFTDYTNDQRTKGKDGKALSKDFDFSKALHDMGEKASPKAVADQYLKWCAANGYTAKFAEFAMEENYYKLLEDFTLYDKDGNYVPQREVRAVFPKADSAFGTMKDLIQEGLQEDAVVEGKRDKSLSAIVDEIQETLPKTEAEIEETQVAQADRDLEAEFKYSSRDYARQVDEVKNNTHDHNSHVYMGSTPGGIAKILELPKLPMLITSQHIYSMAVSEKQAKADGRFKSRTNYHDLGWNTLKKLPEYINDPVMVIKSNTDPNDATFVVVTAQVDSQGNPIIVAIKPNGRGKYFNLEVPTNITLSGYGKNGIQGYVAKAKNENRILYAKKISQKNKANPSVQFADVLLSSDYTTNLAQFKGIVKDKFSGTIFENSGLPKYSDRDTDSVSNRSLLANALESVAQNDIERNKIQEYKGKINLINAEERKLSELNEQIKELSFAKGPKDIKKIRDLQFEANQTANRISTYDKQLLRLEASKPLQAVLDREKKMAYQRAEKKGKEALEKYREKATKTQQELLTRYQESRKKGIENRHRTEMRRKIKDVVSELNQYLLKGDKDKRVMMPLKKAVAEALDAVNMDTVGAEERIAKLEAELMKAKTPEQIQAISRKIDHIRKMGDKMSNRLKDLKDAYREIAESDDPLIANAHDDVIEAKLESVIEKVGNTPLRDMNLEQLGEVYDMYRMVLTAIRNSNKAFKAAKSESIATLGNRVMEEVEQVGGKKRYSLSAVEAMKKFGWNNLKPVYAFEHIGSKTFAEIFKNVRAGEDVWAKDVTEAREFYLEKSKKYKFDSWNMDQWHEFTSTSGMEFSLNLQQIMSLYAFSKRDQAADHLRRGGIVIDESTEITMKTKLGFKVKFNPTEATAYNISDETLADIISKLTPEQKGFVDEMQEYLSTTMGNKGNEVSLELYGIKLFKEKFYFPLKSASQFMAKAKEQQQGEVKIKNSGFSKETVKKASNPIVLTPFMNVWAGHVNEMSMYHAFVLPMEDFYRVYNYRTPTSDKMATESVEMFIQNAYGKGATRYIDQLLKDLNGGARTDPATGLLNWLMGKFKKGAVFASASVVIQQPSAVARAAALIDLKYFDGYSVGTLPKMVKDFAGQSLNDIAGVFGSEKETKHDKEWAELKKYAPVAIIKEMGYFDTNMGKSTKDFILAQEYNTIGEKAKALLPFVGDSEYRDEVLSKAPALADEVAWCAIWRAVKRETKAKHPGMDVKSETFLKLAGERFTEVITKTQVYDSVLSRSANMRSKDTGMKMATAFMAEPTTSINMIADALLKAKRGDKKTCRKAIGSVIASVILNSFLVAWVYAARDDDEDETYREKYISSFLSGIKDGVNPATYIPFLKDAVSIAQGYDVERSDMAVISDLFNAYKQLEKDDVSVWRKVEGFAGSICQIFGLPVKNIMRDVRSVFQVYDTMVHGEKNTVRGTAYAIVEGMPKILGGREKPSNAEQLYNARVRGDEKHAARVEGRYAKGAKNEEEAEKSANAAVRKAITDRYMEGKLTLAQATMELSQYAGMKPNEAYWLMRGWKYKKETGSDDYNQYNDFYEAVQTGKNLKAVIKEYTDNGVKKATLSAQLTDHFKDEYVAMSVAERANIKGYLINAKMAIGYSEETARDMLAEWDFEAKHGSSYNDIVESYKSGAVSETTMRNILAERGYSKSEIEDKISDWNSYKIYGYEYSKLDDAYRAGEISREEFRQAMIDNGTFPAKADQAIITYDWMRDNAQYGLEYADAAKYAHPIENYGYSLSDVGLDPDIYLEYKELKKECQGEDNDNDGKADSGTLRAAKLEMIDSLPINNDQKDALAAIDYSMKSIRRYAPWH